MAWAYNPFTDELDYYEAGVTGSPLSYLDDGTYISVLASTTTLLKYRKSDGQILIKGGLDTDTPL